MSTINIYRLPPYRKDIQGIRFMGALIIMIFHIWVGKVSGGVDIFIFISGYLMTGIYLGLVKKHGWNGWLYLFSGVLKRITPTAVLILFLSALATSLLIPLSEQPSVLKELVASLLHVENFQLMAKSADYLESTFRPSPVQHFWALSVQIQIYIFLVFAVTPVIILSIRKDSFYYILLFYCFICVASFIYSIYGIHINAERTYFDPFARLWEFYAGGVLYLLSPYIDVSRAIRNWLGVAGLTLLFVGAIFIPVGAPYPSWPALLPVTAAALLVLSGSKQDVFSSRILSIRWVAFLGSCSFSIYLWHWPILAFYKRFFRVESVPVPAGIAIILISILISILIYYLVEYQFSKIKKSQLLLSYGLSLSLVLVGGASLYFFVDQFRKEVEVVRMNLLEDANYKSIAEVGHDDEISLESSGFDIRILGVAKAIRPEVYTTGCHRKSWQTDAKVCALHTENNNRVVIAVGASHVAQWNPALVELAKKQRFNLLSMTKSGCQFGEGRPNKKCALWNENVLQKIIEINPTYIIVKGTRTFYEKSEELDPNLLSYVKRIRERGIKVVGIRDNPLFNFEVPECVESAVLESRSIIDCRIKRNDALMLSDVLQKEISGKFDLFVDMSDVFCSELYCYGAYNGLLVYRDKHHLHVPYVKGIARHLNQRMSNIFDEPF